MPASKTSRFEAKIARQFYTELRDGPRRKRENERPRVDGVEAHYRLSVHPIRSALQDRIDASLERADPVRRRLLR